MKKQGRNDPCWCGSGKKYKRCHLPKDGQHSNREVLAQQSGEQVEARDFTYDVCLSFAGEDRSYVAEVADHLALHSVRVFYDTYERSALWGKDLYRHLDHIYQRAARFCVVFISRHYAAKLWTNHELGAAQARAFQENQEYILPARFDETELPGVRATMGYVDLRSIGPVEFSHVILDKLWSVKRHNFMPTHPEALIAFLKPETREKAEQYRLAALECMRNLQLMTPEERTVVFYIFREGCGTELPDNMHVEFVALQRLTGFNRRKLRQILSELRTFGFFAEIRAGRSHGPHKLGSAELVVVRWSPRLRELPAFASEVVAGMLTVATCCLSTQEGYEALHRLDFSRLDPSAHPHLLETESQECPA